MAAVSVEDQDLNLAALHWLETGARLRCQPAIWGVASSSCFDQVTLEDELTHDVPKFTIYAAIYPNSFWTEEGTQISNTQIKHSHSGQQSPSEI